MQFDRNNVSYYAPTVRIVPASALRQYRELYPDYFQKYFELPPACLSLNQDSQYYCGMYDFAYAHGDEYIPYTDQTRIPYSTYYGDDSIMYSDSYRPQPQPKFRQQANHFYYGRSRTAPPYLTPRTYYKPSFQSRSKAANEELGAFDEKKYRYFTGPSKTAKNQPLYKKKRDTSGKIETHQETEFGGGRFETPYRYPRGTFGRRLIFEQQKTFDGRVNRNIDQLTTKFSEVPTLRRIRPTYTPSYTTYPPSIMPFPRDRTKTDSDRYPLALRIFLKIVEILFASAILGLILRPIRDQSLYAFIVRTKTEWQGLVIGITSFFAILALVLLFSSCLLNRYQNLRRIDYLISAIGVIGYVLSGCIEAYYAACYPPDGEKIKEACHIAEWIIATVFLLINSIIYAIDTAMSFRSGINML